MRTYLALAWAAIAAVGCSSGGGAPSGDGSSATNEDLTATRPQLRPRAEIAGRFTRVDLVSDQSGAAALDANLVNAWGLAFSPSGFAWISDNGTGKASVYDARAMLQLTVDLPAAAGSDGSAPSGQVLNDDASAFMGDRFVIASEDGGITGWQPRGGAMLRHDGSSSGAVYKGIAIASCEGTPRLFAADFHNGAIDVFDTTYAPIACGDFVDRDLPTGYAPFNVMADDGVLFVSYALQDADAHDDVKGAGHGFVDAFDPCGRWHARLISRGALDSPWGMAIEHARHGRLRDRLLVGNFGDGRIDVYAMDLHHGLHVAREGALGDARGAPLVIDGLWAIAFAPDAGTFDGGLYFTAGPDDESHGRFGRLDPAR